MSAAILWIIIPLFFSILIWFLRQYSKSVMYIGAAFSVLITLSAFFLKVDYTYLIGNVPFKIEPEMNLLGRALIIADSDRAIVFLLYLLTTFWLLLGAGFDSLPSYAAYALTIVSFLVASLAVEPFLFSALFIILAVIISIPMLIRMPKKTGRGEVFYLTFMTLAVPFLLFASWSASSVESSVVDVDLIQKTTVLFVIGFSLLLSAFPFFIWIPKLAEQFRPARVYFLLSILPVGCFLIFSKFLIIYPWLRNAEFFSDALNFSGLLLIVFGGILAAFQNDAGRMMGFGVILENGFLFLALGFGIEPRLQYLAILIFSRLMGLGVWGISTTIYGYHRDGFSLKQMKNLMWEYPFVSAGLLFAFFSIGGLPLFGGFPAKALVIQEIVTQRAFMDVFWILLGEIGFIVGGLRLLSAIIGEAKGEKIIVKESWLELIFLLLGVLGLFILGIFPSFSFGLLLQFFNKVGYLQF